MEYGDKKNKYHLLRILEIRSGGEKRKNTRFKISLISYVKVDVIVCIKVLFMFYLDENFVI